MKKKNNVLALDNDNWRKFKNTATTLENIKINSLRKMNTYYYLTGISTAIMGKASHYLLCLDQGILPNNLTTKIILALTCGGCICLTGAYGIMIVNTHKKIKKYKLDRETKYNKLVEEYEALYNDKIKTK